MADDQQQVYVPDEQPEFDDADYMESLKTFREHTNVLKRKAAAATAAKSATSSDTFKKSFVADNGIRYVWDEEEDDWVEGDDNDEDYDDDDDDQEGDEDEYDGHTYKKSASGSSGNSKLTGKTTPKATGNAPTMIIDEHESEVPKPKRIRKNKSKKKKPPVNNWVYITGLPADVTEEELKEHFSKVGMIAINPVDQTRKIKIYRESSSNNSGSSSSNSSSGDDISPPPCKGDASVCYACASSVDTAVDILHEGYLRPTHRLTVTRAEFKIPNTSSSSSSSSGGVSISGGGSGGDSKRVNADFSCKVETSSCSSSSASSASLSAPPRAHLTNAQIKIANYATKQALQWGDEDASSGIMARSKALKIVVIQGMFRPEDLLLPPPETVEQQEAEKRETPEARARRQQVHEDSILQELEEDLGTECLRKCGAVEKITIFSKHPQGIITVRFQSAYAAAECIRVMDGRWYDKTRLRSFYWDGVTNYTVTSGDLSVASSAPPSSASTSLSTLTADAGSSSVGATGVTESGCDAGASTTITTTVAAAAPAVDTEEQRLEAFGSWLEEQEEEEEEGQ